MIPIPMLMSMPLAISAINLQKRSLHQCLMPS